MTRLSIVTAPMLATGGLMARVLMANMLIASMLMTSGSALAQGTTPSGQVPSGQVPVDVGPNTPAANGAYQGGGVILQGAPGAPAPKPQPTPPGKKPKDMVPPPQ